MKGNILYLLILSLVCCSISSCNKEVKSNTLIPLIGLSFDSFVEERWIKDRDIFLATAKRLGATVLVQEGDEDPVLQEKQIALMLEKKINSLVVMPNNPDSLTKILLEAKKQNIPVLCYERLARNANVDLFLSFDAEKAGFLQGEGILNKITTGSIAIYNGQKNDPVAEEQHSGVMRALQESIDKNQISIVDDYWPRTQGSQEADDYTRLLIESGKKIDAIIAASDMQAEAIILALSRYRKATIIQVAGVGADISACQRIAEGTQALTVYKPIELLAGTACELSFYLIKNQRVSVHNAISDGTYRIPHYKLAPILVTKENLDTTVIKDGYLRAEDIYRNVIIR